MHPLMDAPEPNIGDRVEVRVGSKVWSNFKIAITRRPLCGVCLSIRNHWFPTNATVQLETGQIIFVAPRNIRTI